MVGCGLGGRLALGLEKGSRMRRLALSVAVMGFMLMGCNQLPTPPALYDRTGLYYDTLPFGVPFSDTIIVLKDSVNGLIQDTLGIWRDMATTNFDNRNGSWSYGPPFMDVPPSYRQFWRYCSNCHTSLGKSAYAPAGRKVLLLNTWEQILSYGPERLILAARGGGMPLAPAAKVPDDVLGRAQAYLASWGDTAQRILLMGYRWPEAENFVRKYCSDCHAPGGRHPQSVQAMLYLMLDTYDQWHKREEKIKGRIDTAADPLSINVMPPDTLPLEKKPTVEERRRMMEWIDRFSPNTPDGSGIGDSVFGGDIMTSGAMQGLVYDTAFKMINRFCADCHTEVGLNREQPDGYLALRVDTYASWKGIPIRIIMRRLDIDSAAKYAQTLMPPDNFANQPTAAERQLLADWLKRGSPNTVSGN